MSFAAKYSGTCVECENKINVGDQINLTDEGAAHTDCSESGMGSFSRVPIHGGRASSLSPGKKRGKICPKCHTEKSVNGVCPNFCSL